MENLITAINQLTAALDRVNQSLQVHFPKMTSELPIPKTKSSTIESSIAGQSTIKKSATSPLAEQSESLKSHLVTSNALPESICNWFRKYQLGFAGFNHCRGNTERIRQLSFHIARYYAVVRPLMIQLNQHASGGRVININLRKEAVNVISQTVGVASKMNELGFLQQFQYRKSPHCALKTQSNGLPATQSYLKGKWFELAVEQQLHTIKHSVPHLEWVANPVIQTQKGQQREIDFIISFEQETFVVEVTTSQWQKKATQVISLANQLQIPVKRCFIISPDTDHQTMQEFSSLHGCNILSFQQFPHWIDDYHQQQEQSRSSKADNIIVMESCVL